MTAIGQTSQLTATATLNNGTSQNVTATATWQSSNALVATVSGSGLVTAMSNGAASIVATFQGKAASAAVTVTSGAGPIASCGTYSGPGPLTVASDILLKAANCLTFSGTVNGQLDCQGHDVSSVALLSVDGFSITHCAMRAGVNMTLRIITSRNVTVTDSEVVGSLFAQAGQNNTFDRSAFRWPLLPANNSGFESGEIYLNGGQNNSVTNSTIDGGWDGNFATYQRQGCDDGILIQNEVNSVIRGNTIMNVFDAGIESSVSQAPITTTIEGNTINHAGYTGIGGYYVQGWQNSIFSGNIVTGTPSVLEFNDAGARQGTVTLLTLLNNRFENNVLQGAVPLPPLYGARAAAPFFIVYGSSGVPTNMSGNIVANNRFGTTTPAPVLFPTSGFIDGGGNICASGGFLTCVGGSFAGPLKVLLPPAQRQARH